MRTFAGRKSIRLVTFQTVLRGNWRIRVSMTDISFMLMAQSAQDHSKIYTRFFSSKEDIISFVDFLVDQKEWPEPV